MRVCNRCGTVVEKETEIEGYPYYCPDCDENMYEFETEERKFDDEENVQRAIEQAREI